MYVCTLAVTCAVIISYFNTCMYIFVFLKYHDMASIDKCVLLRICVSLILAHYPTNAC